MVAVFRISRSNDSGGEPPESFSDAGTGAAFDGTARREEKEMGKSCCFGGTVVRSLAVVPHAFLSGVAAAFFMAGGCGDETGPSETKSAVLEVSPDPVELPDTNLGSRSVLFVELWNEGDGDLELADVPFLVEDEEEDGSAISAGEMLVDCEEPDTAEEAESLVLPPGDCRALELTFSPLETGVFQRELRIESNAEGGDEAGVHLVPVVGTAVAPKIELCLPQSECVEEEVCWSSFYGERPLLTFDKTSLEESRSCPVGVNNLGDGLLKVTGWGFSEGNRFGDFSLNPSQLCDIELEPGESVELEVSFSPMTGGVREGTIAITSDDPSPSNIWIDVSGIGEGPRVCVDPMPLLDFGEVVAGETVQGTVALESCGTMALDVTDAWTTNATGTDESDVYFISEGAPVSAHLEPGEKLSLPIDFSPLEPGVVNGRVYFATNDPVAPRGYINLTGEGLPPPVCELVVDGGYHLPFGIVEAGEHVVRGLQVSNRGELACSEVEGAVTGGEEGFFEHVSPSAQEQPFEIEPGESVFFDLRYAPESADGLHEAAFTITTSDAGDIEVSLSGDASEEPVCNLVLSPKRTGKHMPERAGFDWRRWMDFEDVAVGDTETLSVLLENVGSADCTVDETGLLELYPLVPVEGFEATASGGKVEVDGEQTSVISPGEVGEINVRFTPLNAHFHRGRLVISTDDPASADTDDAPGTYEVGLTGKGVRARAAAVPERLDFGEVTGGCVSRVREVNVWATGGMPVTLEEPALEGDGSFELIAAPEAGETLLPGKKVTYEIRFVPPEGSGTHEAALKVGTSAGGEVVVDLEGRSTEETFWKDEHLQADEPKVDVLWVIDDSPRMSDFAAHLGHNVHEFMVRHKDMESDAQYGVITTDWSDPDKSGRLQGDPLVVTLDHPDPVQAVLDNAYVGTGGHYAEQPFEMAVRALSEPLASGHNAGFRRKGARLEVIFVGTGIEQSEGTVAYYADFLHSLKPPGVPFDIYIVAGNPETGCAIEHGRTLPGDRYFDLAETAPRAQLESFCDSWGPMADRICLGFGRQTFSLSREPDLSTLQVLVDGDLVPKAGNWEYRVGDNTIVFDTSSIPGPGSTIEIFYEALCRSS